MSSSDPLASTSTGWLSLLQLIPLKRHVAWSTSCSRTLHYPLSASDPIYCFSCFLPFSWNSQGRMQRSHYSGTSNVLLAQCPESVSRPITGQPSCLTDRQQTGYTPASKQPSREGSARRRPLVLWKLPLNLQLMPSKLSMAFSDGNV